MKSKLSNETTPKKADHLRVFASPVCKETVEGGRETVSDVLWASLSDKAMLSATAANSEPDDSTTV